jgi:hypothetical protein
MAAASGSAMRCNMERFKIFDGAMRCTRVPDDNFWQRFSRLSSRLSVEKISHNSAFLMKA